MRAILDYPLVEKLARKFAQYDRLPVRVRHWPYLFLDRLRNRPWLRRQREARGAIHFVFFTCRRHFEMLRYAAESLAALHYPHLKGVTAFVDESDFFDPGQEETLRCLLPAIELRKWPGVRCWGAATMARQVRAFLEIAERLDESDYLAKADSDLLFFSPRIFDAVRASGRDAIGDGHYIDFKFFQGGLFFLRKSIILRLGPYAQEEAITALAPEAGFRDDNDIHDDRCTSVLLRRVEANIWMTRFMMFPDELRTALQRPARLRGCDRSGFCAIHFVRGKETMPDICRDEVLPLVTGKSGYFCP